MFSSVVFVISRAARPIGRAPGCVSCVLFLQCAMRTGVSDDLRFVEADLVGFRRIVLLVCLVKGYLWGSVTVDLWWNVDQVFIAMLFPSVLCRRLHLYFGSSRSNVFLSSRCGSTVACEIHIWI